MLDYFNYVVPKYVQKQGDVVMETLLQAVIIVFMLFLCLLCLFAVIVIVRDIIMETLRARNAESKCEPPQTVTVVKQTETEQPVKQESAVKAESLPVSEVVAAVQPQPERIVESVQKEESTERVNVSEDDENAVAFSRTGFTMEEKFAMLSSEFKTYFNDIVRYVLAKDSVKETKRSGAYDYKDGSRKLMRISIKRGEIVCDFFFMDRDFINYTKTTNVKVKQAPATIRVTDAQSVGVAKDGIDRVCKQAADEKEYKKELARQKRRERRQKANATAREDVTDEERR